MVATIMRTRRIVANGVEKMVTQLQIEYHGVVVSKKNSKVIRMNRHTGQRFITSNSVAKRMTHSVLGAIIPLSTKPIAWIIRYLTN